MSAVTNLTSILLEQERTRVQSLIQCKPAPLVQSNSGKAKAHGFIACGAHDGERDAGRLWHGVLLTQSQERHAPLADVGVGADPRAGTLEQIAFSRTLFP
jgi:hypothetical protein